MINPLRQWIPDRGIIRQNLIRRLQTNTTEVISNLSVPEIQVPFKKERGPTDVLRALERTIKRDQTAPLYKYHDDPYLIPISNNSKRWFALAQESGRKTAMWIRQQHADLFQHRVADPMIESFLPRAVYAHKEDVNEDILKNMILSGHVEDSIAIYKLLDEKTTIETKQSLFELLCYHNNAQPLSSDLLNENWYRKVEKKITWKNCSETDQLFAFLKTQDMDIAIDAYNAMICATSKYMKVDKAWELFIETEEKNIPLFLLTYNNLIATIPMIKDGTVERRELLIEMLEKMEKSGVKPSICTLNSSLIVASSIYQTQLAQDMCRSLFNEFKYIGIKPSLASYYHALRIFYRNGEKKSALLNEILEEAEGREFAICDTQDTYFFFAAMDIAATVLEDPVIGDRIHKLLLTGKNYDFLSDGYKESIYYRHYCMLQVQNRTIDEFFKYHYDVIVPHVYTPEPTVIDAILDAVAANDPEISTPILSRFWTHIVQFGVLERKNLIAKTLNLMRTQCKPTAESPINKVFSQAAWTVWEHVMNEHTGRIVSIKWNGSILGDIAVLLLRGDEFEKCARIISYFYNEQKSIAEVPITSQIEELLEACILRGYPETAVDLVHYCSDCGFVDVPTMVRKVWRNLPLNEWQENRLKSLVSPDVLEVSTGELQ